MNFFISLSYSGLPVVLDHTAGLLSPRASVSLGYGLGACSPLFPPWTAIIVVFASPVIMTIIGHNVMAGRCKWDFYLNVDLKCQNY